MHLSTHHLITLNGAIYGKYYIGKYNIFHTFDKAMLFVMVKACLYFKIIMFARTFEKLVFLMYEHLC